MGVKLLPISRFRRKRLWGGVVILWLMAALALNGPERSSPYI
jgi:hypothetical protein